MSEPTDWVSSMVIVQKPDKQIRLCLDPTDLNKFIRREHFPLPTIEELCTNLSGVKVFSVCDAKNGSWQVQLSEDSRKLTTFNSPFGRYCYNRMPLESAPPLKYGSDE